MCHLLFDFKKLLENALRLVTDVVLYCHTTSSGQQTGHVGRFLQQQFPSNDTQNQSIPTNSSVECFLDFVLNCSTIF